MKGALKGQPIVPFPAPANIGGTDPVPYATAVPTLDPALAVTPTPKPIQKFSASPSAKATPKTTKKK